MKRRTIIIILATAFLFASCNSLMFLHWQRKRVEKHGTRTERLVNKLHQKSDTIYVYYNGYPDYYNTVWYSKSGYLYVYKVYRYRTGMRKRVKIDASITCEENLDHYFSENEPPEPCFDKMWSDGHTLSLGTLDGYVIEVFIKGKDGMRCDIDKRCLYSNKYPKNSFPFVLQYYFSRIQPYEQKFNDLYPEMVILQK